MTEAVGAVVEECIESVRSLYSEAEEQAIETCQDRLRELSERLAAERALARGVTAGPICDKTDNKATRSAMRLMPMDAKAKGEVGVEWKWGGSEGTTVSSYAKGSVSDDEGSYVRATAEHEWGGEGNASVAVGGSKTFENDTQKKENK